MMFNYSIPSNSSAIMQAFYQEYHILSNPNFIKHPNIIKLYTQFVDKTPLLDDAIKSYPVALPIGSCSGAIGHKETLFLAMPKYACTLNEYLKTNGKTLTFLEQMHLLCQLFEAVSHLECNNIAHRDIKSDNILIDFCMKEPMLVLSDFGCCIEGMSLKFESYNICRGGSAALLSPEVISGVPGRCSILDYSKNDVWAAATLAYEIFDGYNPFYTTLSNMSYEECNLPLLNSGSELVDKIIFNSLRKDRSNRLSACEASTLLFVAFYTPHEWYSRDVSHKDVESWLVYSFVMIIRKCVGYERYYQLPSPIKLQLTFFSRYSPECIIAALNVLKSLKAAI